MPAPSASDGYLQAIAARPSWAETLLQPGRWKKEQMTVLAKLVAFSGDCQVFGTITLAAGERLTDVLNREAVLLVADADLVSHADGHVVHLAEIALDRDELFAIEAVGPRGLEQRRVHTVRHRLEVSLGPYTVLGQLHTFPGGRPLVAVSRRAPMVPLTDATIAFSGHRGVQIRDVATLIINRDRARWVRPEEADLSAFDALPAGSRAVTLLPSAG